MTRFRWFFTVSLIFGLACGMMFPGTRSHARTPSVQIENEPSLHLPKPGDASLLVISPTLLDLVRINTKPPDPGRVDCWDFVGPEAMLQLPSASQFKVEVNQKPVKIRAIGFKRRPLYAPLSIRDLRIENHLFLELETPVADGAVVTVTNPSGELWPDAMKFNASALPLRYSPAIHVNQEGYIPGFPKKGMVGFYCGTLGELEIPESTGFTLVDNATGTKAFSGMLQLRPESGFAIKPAPYQKVLEADFSGFTKPGEYRLVVPGVGASVPFRIDEGIAMDFARTYALGLFHQRCGYALELPFTRHIHPACHTAPAEVPVPQSSFEDAWKIIANDTADYAKNPRHTAPRLESEASQLYPFVRTGKIDVSGGHHDAGDYSKYTINSAQLIHYLVFAADAFPGAGALDNLGIPESGDGKSDLLQEAKWEADFLAKLQDDDGAQFSRDRVAFGAGTRPRRRANCLGNRGRGARICRPEFYIRPDHARFPLDRSRGLLAGRTQGLCLGRIFSIRAGQEIERALTWSQTIATSMPSLGL